MFDKNNEIIRKQQEQKVLSDASLPKKLTPKEEFRAQLKSDEKARVAMTEKLSFEICASLIAYEVKGILVTINRQLAKGGVPTGKPFSI